METIKKVVIDVREYVKRRDRIIDILLASSVKVFPKDMDMLHAVIDYTTALKTAEPNLVSCTVVDDLLGFMNWHGMNQDSPTLRKAVSTIMHDLGEFKVNRDKSWFAPRTAGYSKYLKAVAS